MKRLIAFFMLIASLAPGLALAIEEPQFQLLDKSSTVEIRQYRPMLVAEVQIDGSYKEASSVGFKMLADYILGKNVARQHAGGEKIAMTAPYVSQLVGDKTAANAAARWRIQFIMPAEYTLATLPTPVDPRVTIRQIPARKRVVLVFSGLAGEDRVNRKTEELWRWVGSKNIKTSGTVQLARYNIPWAIPFWRRNELWLDAE